MIKHTRMLLASLFIGGCEQPRSIPEGPVPIPVVVADCYSSDKELRVSIYGEPLPLWQAEERDDSDGLCFWEVVGIEEESEITLTVDGERSYEMTVDWVAEKTLLISARHQEHTKFAHEDELAFD